MNLLQGYLVFRLLMGLAGMGLVVLMAYFVIGGEVMSIVKAENLYKQEYGDSWREHYLAQRQISVEDDHRKAMFGVGGLITMTGLCFLIYRQMVPRRTGHKRSRRRRRSSSIPT